MLSDTPRDPLLAVDLIMTVPLVVGGMVVLFMTVIAAVLAPRLRHELDERDARITFLQKALFRSYQRRNDLLQESATAQSNLAKLSSEHDVLKKSHDNLTASWDRVNEHNKTIKARNSDLDQEVKDLGQEIKSLWHRNKAIEDNNVSLRTTCQATKTSISDLATRHAALQTLYTQTHHQNTDLKRSLTRVQVISADNARRATRSSTALRSAETKLFDLQGYVAFHKDVVGRLADAKAGLEKAVEALSETVKAQAGTVEDMGKELAWYKYAFDEAGAHAQWDFSEPSNSSESLSRLRSAFDVVNEEAEGSQDLVAEPVLVEPHLDDPTTYDDFDDVSAFSDTHSVSTLSLLDLDTFDFSPVELLESDDDGERIPSA
jgi:chromosome segregation ATPase